MKKLLPLIVACMLVVGLGNAHAQTAENPASFNLRLGIAGYDGDLGNTLIDFDNDADAVVGAGMAFYLNDFFDLSIDANFTELRKVNSYRDNINAKRGTEFTTNLVNANLMLRWKVFGSGTFTPYIAAGVGGNYYNIEKGGYFDNVNTPQDETRVGTPEENGELMFSIPFGIGANYNVSEKISLNVQAIYNRSFIDDIDNFPASPQSVDYGNGGQGGFADLDGNDHDDFLFTTLGVVFNFGGDEEEGMNMEQRLLRQSMRNLEAAEESSNESTATLRQAQQLNDETLAALEQLQEAMMQDDDEGEEMRAEMVRIVNNIQFEFDSAEIIEPAYDELNSLANIMSNYQGLRVNVAGHADQRGSQSYNEELSMERAQAVKDYLVSRGVSASRVTTRALGQDSPLMSGNSATSYAQNRAVQLTLSYRNQ